MSTTPEDLDQEAASPLGPRTLQDAQEPAVAPVTQNTNRPRRKNPRRKHAAPSHGESSTPNAFPGPSPSDNSLPSQTSSDAEGPNDSDTAPPRPQASTTPITLRSESQAGSSLQGQDASVEAIAPATSRDAHASFPLPPPDQTTWRPTMPERGSATQDYPRLYQNPISEFNLNSGSNSSSNSNLIAPSSVPATPPQNTFAEYRVPRWQPDSEVTNCPICGALFTMLYRKHHCRKCGRVVCDRCSPHRIIIPSQFVVRPSDHSYNPQQRFLYGNEGGIADFSSIGGGERVRLCNPCVPDPNMTPPPPPQQPERSLPPFHLHEGLHPTQRAPVVMDGRSPPRVFRPQRNSLGHHHRGSSGSDVYSQWLSAQGFSSRMRSATMGAGHGQAYLPPPLMNAHRAVFGQYLPNIGPAADPRGPHSRSHSSEAFPSGLNRPLPRTPTPEISEEDICPVCHLELPSRALANSESLRETHINNCIASRISHGAARSTGGGESGSHGTPPPRTTRRTRMIPYVATEKDSDGNQECIICLENFVVGEEMARLECFCRFHRHCIDSWFVNHPGRCPVHQHDSYGY